jgi:hypothetical protein
VVAADVLVAVALAFGLATYGRFRDGISGLKLGSFYISLDGTCFVFDLERAHVPSVPPGASFYLTLVALALLVWVRIFIMRANALAMVPKTPTPVRVARPRKSARAESPHCLSHV